jgi:hypothetical protein
MKIRKSQLKRIIKEELNRVQIEKLVHMVLNHPIFSAAQYLLPKSLISTIREEMVSFLYENQDIAAEALDLFLSDFQVEAVKFVMEYVVKPLINRMGGPEREGRGRVYKVLDDDGEGLYFEDEFIKEIHYTSSFIKELNRAVNFRAGFTYARRLLRLPDGGTDFSDQPVFLYHGNREYVEIMKSIALRHGIMIR